MTSREPNEYSIQISEKTTRTAKAITFTAESAALARELVLNALGGRTCGNPSIDRYLTTTINELDFDKVERTFDAEVISMVEWPKAYSVKWVHGSMQASGHAFDTLEEAKAFVKGIVAVQNAQASSPRLPASDFVKHIEVVFRHNIRKETKEGGQEREIVWDVVTLATYESRGDGMRGQLVLADNPDDTWRP